MSSIAPDVPVSAARTQDASAAPVGGTALVLAGALAVIAAGVHMLVTPEHLAAWWGYGAFFIVITNVEIAIVGLLVIKPSTWAIQVAIWTTLATLLMYLVSRTAGIPLGPDAGMVEAVDALGVVATVAEAGLLVLMCGMLADRARSRTLTVLAAIGVLLWGAALTGVLSPGANAVVGGHGESAQGHGASAAAHRATLPVIPDSVRSKPR
jgi:hypothetical protein